MGSRGSELTGLLGHCLHALPEQGLSVLCAPKGLLTGPYSYNKCMVTSTVKYLETRERHQEKIEKTIILLLLPPTDKKLTIFMLFF